MSQLTVLFRVDASSVMGMGHVMRCLAIAEAVVDSGGKALFVMFDPIPSISAMIFNIPARLIRLKVKPNSIDDLNELRQLISTHKPIVTVVDGYHFSDSYHSTLAKSVPTAVLWDSANRGEIPVDVIIDASPNAPADEYRRIAPHAILMLGSQHALIRRDIRKAAFETYKSLEDRHKIVLSFGGSDPLNLCMSVLPELAHRLPENIEITVLVGPTYPLQQELKNLAGRLGSPDRINVIINPTSVAKLFCSAGLVVSAAGGTIGELVALRIPALSVIVADNQIAASVNGPYPTLDGRTFESAVRISETAVNLWEDLNKRESLIQDLLPSLDCLGAIRVATTLLSTNYKERFQLC
jgi:UDP-2,4-diacetamido-2,4,6-trideoxy-beta-L-altropyranose hydrolase